MNLERNDNINEHSYSYSMGEDKDEVEKEESITEKSYKESTIKSKRETFKSSSNYVYLNSIISNENLYPSKCQEENSYLIESNPSFSLIQKKDKSKILKYEGKRR